MTRVGPALHHARHLLRRFAGSLSPRPPTTADEAWAELLLLDGERTLWRRMSNQDRRHAIVVARRFEQARAGRAGRAELAGALLHDVGKVAAGLGTFGRVLATLTPPGLRRGRGAIYHDHEAIGARWCAQAGSDPLTVALVAGEGAPRELLAVLEAADDV